MTASPPYSCIYRGNQSGEQAGQPLYPCQLYGQCAMTHLDGLPACDSCLARLPPDAADLAVKWLDPLSLIDGTRAPTHALRGFLRGGSAFLLCGGPSIKWLPLETLNRRGCWTMAVNNVAGGRLRPQAFVCSDPPLKFSHCIWRDPAIMKFVPSIKLKRKGKGTLRRKLADGTFVNMEGGTISCPNTWGFLRRSWMKPDSSFFTTNDAAWGNHNDGVQATGEDKTVCTMLLGLRLLRYLGARRIFLLGADFYMQPGDGYGFAQQRTLAAAASNNAQFATVNAWLCRMQTAGVFKRFGVDIYNCYQTSSLRAFPYVSFGEAVEVACAGIEAVPDLAGWYEDKTISKSPQ